MTDPKPLAAPLSRKCNCDEDAPYHYGDCPTRAEVAAPLPEPTEDTICTLHDKLNCVECEGITKALAYIATKVSPLPEIASEPIDDDRITGIYCRFCSVEIHKETRNWVHKNGSLTCANGQHAADPPKKSPVPLGEPAHVCMYDSDVLPMQYGENLPPDVEQYNSLFCKCGRVNHYGTWIPALATKAVPIQDDCCRTPHCGGECTCEICAPDLAIRDLKAEVDSLKEELEQLSSATNRECKRCGGTGIIERKEPSPGGHPMNVSDDCPVCTIEAVPIGEGEPDIEVLWEEHSQLMEVIECDFRGDVTLMKKKDFEKAVASILSRLRSQEGPQDAFQQEA